jgi:lysophospholipase L1-like esterase
MKQFEPFVLNNGPAGLFFTLKAAPRRAASFPVAGRIFMGAVLAACSAFSLPAASLQFTQVEFVPTGIHLVWNAASGQYYSVLASSNLLNWTSTSVRAAGQFIDTNAVGGRQMFYRVKEDINPNPIISIGKTAYANTSNPNVVTDGKFLTSGWGGGSPSPAAPVWVAENLGLIPTRTRVLLEWNAGYNYNYADPITPTSTPAPDYGSPLNYSIYTSSNSTTGADGTWTLVASVTNNIYRTRSHSFDFTGMSWIKMSVTAIPTFSANGLSLDEIEVYNTTVSYSRGRIAEDTWFFMGDSITAFWGNRATATGTNDPTSHMPDFAQCIKGYNSYYFPSMIDGGIGGETTANALARLPTNLVANPDYYYWALGYGSNDSAGNNANTTTFKNNMQAMIDLLLANGRMPVIPHIPYAADGQHNFIPNFNTVIDNLVATNHILAGPDLYTFFQANTNQLQADGLHPNDAGMRSDNLLWAQAMRHLYP